MVNITAKRPVQPLAMYHSMFAAKTRANAHETSHAIWGHNIADGCLKMEHQKNVPSSVAKSTSPDAKKGVIIVGNTPLGSAAMLKRCQIPSRLEEFIFISDIDAVPLTNVHY